MADIVLSGFKGIHNVLPAERIKSLPTKDDARVDLATAVNVDLDDSGMLSRRAGQELKVAGSAHSIWTPMAQDVCLYVAGTQLKRLNSDMSSTVLAIVTAGMPASYVEVNNRIYWTNGIETGLVDGLNRSWGMEIPELSGLSAIAGTLEAGKYQAAITHVRRDGQESGAGMTQQITLTDGQGVRFAWDAVTDADIAEVNLYLSTANGMELYLVGTQRIDAGSADVTGGAFALPLNTAWLDKPPAGQCLAHHNGRILIGSGEYIFGTVALGYEYVDLRDFLAVDGTRIGFLLGVTGGLFIGTAKAVYFASGSRLEEYSLKTVVAAPCVPRSGVLADGMAVTGNKALSGRQVALFATGMGVCMGMDDGSIVNLTHDRFQYDAGTTGAAVFRNDDLLKQYLLFMS